MAAGISLAAKRPPPSKPPIELTARPQFGKILPVLSLSPSDFLASPVWEAGCFVLGLIVGSFANVCIYRLPLGLSIVSPGSRCPACKQPIRAWDNVPVLSYLVLLGRCRSCRARIPLRYPAVETANGLAYLAVALAFGPTLQAPVMMIFLTALLVLSLIDLDHQLLPDVITLPGVAVGLAASFLPGAPLRPLTAAASALGGYASLAVIGKGYKLFRGQEGIGRGDWKMAAMLGAFLGWEGMLLTVFVASLCAATLGVLLVQLGRKRMQDPLPLGTALGWAGMLVVFLGAPVIAWYKGVLRV